MTAFNASSWHTRLLISVAAPAFLIFAALFTYFPGLNGPFLFDDFANLPALGSHGGIVDRESVILFVFGNESSPTGRPLAMLSFLINDIAWPSNARSFKYTNLLLHTINGLLLYLLVYRLMFYKYSSYTLCTSIALITSLFWLLHPLNVSTVLYPVQRMTILSAMFSLIGLTGYVYSRQYIKVKPVKGYALMSLSLSIGATLALLSKENGALLPLLAWVLEFYFLSKYCAYPLYKPWKVVFFWLPALAIVSYLTISPFYWGDEFGYSLREFTLSERLLTQARVLMNYLFYWIVPQANSPGLLTQDIPISKDLFTPITTFTSVAGFAIILAISWVTRNRFQYISLGILFYLCGHLLESTTIPLEIYFEHRNYLPAMLLILPVSIFAVNLHDRPAQKSILIIALLTIPPLIAFQRASTWGDEQKLAYSWASAKPDSQRAQRYAVEVARKAGNHTLALSIIDNARKSHKDWIPLHMDWLQYACHLPAQSTTDLENIFNLIETGKFNFNNISIIQTTAIALHSDNCMLADPHLSYRLLDTLENNYNAIDNPSALHQLAHIRGHLLLLDRNFDLSLEQFKRSLKYAPVLDTGLKQVSLLASASQFTLALTHLTDIKNNIPLSRNIGSLDYMREIQRLENLLIQDINSMP